MTDRDRELLLKRAADAKLVHLNEQLIFPLLETKVEQALASLCEAYKAKGEVKTQDIAMITVCRELALELTQKARHGDQATTKLLEDQ